MTHIDPSEIQVECTYCQTEDLGFPGGSDGKESAFNVRDLGLIPGLGRSQPTPVFLPRESLWTEEPGGL